VLETAKVLRDHGLIVEDAVVVLNRGQGGEQALKANGIRLHSLCHISYLLDVLLSSSKISKEIKGEVETFVKKNQVYPPLHAGTTDSCLMSYESRFAESANPNLKNLCRIMMSKRSNLCLAADLKDTDEIIRLVQAAGPHIVCLKTHLDFFSDEKDRSRFIERLRDLSQKYDFLIFEDRKYADIGATVVKQYERVVNIADIVTLHGLPGPGVITGLKSIAKESSSGLIVAEMSSEGNLASKEYAKECAKMAEDHLDFVLGLVSQSRLTNKIHISSKNDELSQKYVSPEEAVLHRKADVIIVGRGITSDSDRYVESAVLYKERGWKAYERRIGK
ncbi:Uridine 5'monophosphate synthaselike, partial [Caligus rogercresseyi]